MPASAYLCVFDDWHLLTAAVSSIADRVDEIVVVDGAYAWMAPFLDAVGRDPSRSGPQVAAALEPFACKLVWLHGIWANEIAKRAAGYAACRNRHVFRIDSDEVLFFDEAALDAFMVSDAAVAEMDMPLAVTPTLIRGMPGQRLERQALLFDQEHIGPMEHLAYLWLVLPPAERAQLGKPAGGCIFAEPIAYNAHLTHWRPPESAVNRARFYVLNWLRDGNVLSFAPHAAYTPASGFAALLATIPAESLTEYLMGHAIVAGAPAMQSRGLMPCPLRPDQIATFAPLHTESLAGLVALNSRLALTPRLVARGEAVSIDVSTPAAYAPFVFGGRLHLRFSLPLAVARVELLTLQPHPPWETRAELPCVIELGGISVALVADEAAIRRTLHVVVWPHGPDTFLAISAPDRGDRVASQDGPMADR